MKVNRTQRLMMAGIFFIMMMTLPSCSDRNRDQWLPATEAVNGEQFEIQGMPILKVWGTPYEQGYANGYLMAPEIYEFYLEVSEINGLTGDILTNQYYPLLPQLVMPEIYAEELRGILAGLEARAGGPVYMPPLGRSLTYEDLLAGHAILELNDLNCSSFTAWGCMTEDGSLMGGTNREWYDFQGVVKRNNQMVIVRIPEAGSGRKAWLCIDVPGTISCSMAINEAGLFIHQHDVDDTRPRTVHTGYIIDDLIFREVVEKAESNYSGVSLRNLVVPFVTNDGTNMMVGMPYLGNNEPSFKFELDGDESFESGVSIWKPEPSTLPFRVCTSHFRKRLPPPPPSETPRFVYLSNQLKTIYNSNGQIHLTEEHIWEMLQNSRLQNYDAVHSIIYEPNRMMMHIAYLLSGQTVSDIAVVSLDLRELFKKN